MNTLAETLPDAQCFYCPVAQECFARDAVIGEDYAARVKGLEDAEARVRAYRPALIEHETEVALAESAITLHKLEAQGADIISVAEAGFVLRRSRKEAQRSAIRLGQAVTAVELAERKVAVSGIFGRVATDSLAEMRAAKRMCTGTALNGRGKLRLASAALRRLFRRPSQHELIITRNYLLSNGYAKCTSKLAKTALDHMPDTNKPQPVKAS